MAATQGTLIFRGRSGRTYVRDMYLDDVAAAPANLDSGGGASATSETFCTLPEQASLEDVSIVTGAAQTKLQVTRNGQPTGDMIRQTLHLNTLAARPHLAIPFNPTDKIAFNQIA